MELFGGFWRALASCDTSPIGLEAEVFDKDSLGCLANLSDAMQLRVRVLKFRQELLGPCRSSRCDDPEDVGPRCPVRGRRDERHKAQAQAAMHNEQKRDMLRLCEVGIVIRLRVADQLLGGRPRYFRRGPRRNLELCPEGATARDGWRGGPHNTEGATVPTKGAERAGGGAGGAFGMRGAAPRCGQQISCCNSFFPLVLLKERKSSRLAVNNTHRISMKIGVCLDNSPTI